MVLTFLLTLNLVGKTPTTNRKNWRVGKKCKAIKRVGQAGWWAFRLLGAFGRSLPAPVQQTAHPCKAGGVWAFFARPRSA